MLVEKWLPSGAGFWHQSGMAKREKKVGGDVTGSELVKRCTKCGEVKEVDAFGRHRATADGFQYWCKKCQRVSNVAYRSGAAGREHQSAAQRKFARSEHGREANRQHRRNYRKTARGRFQRLKASARRRGLPVGVGADWFARWWNSEPNVCAYCGGGLEESRRLIELLSEYGGRNRMLVLLKNAVLREPGVLNHNLTVDRVDGQRGYEDGNLVKACWLCNKVKGYVLTGDEMRIVGPRLRRDLKAGLSEGGGGGDGGDEA